MHSRRVLGATLVLALGIVSGLAAGLAVPSAQAATGSPPATAPDSATVLQGNFVAVFPIKNDHDPDNDLLTICRLGTEHYKGIDVSYYGDEVDIAVSPNVHPGAYTFTYYTCDFSYLVPGTITLTVADLPDIKVTPAGKGKIKVKNPFDFKIRFLYGSFKEDAPDGKAVIPAGKRVVLTVKRHKIDWIADARKGTIFCGSGHVTGIDLRVGDRGPVGSVAVPQSLSKVWRTAS